MSLAQFEEWFIPETWDVERHGEETVRSITLAVMRLLVKHSNRQLTEGELRRDLGILSRNYWFDQAPKTVLLSSSAQLIREDPPVQAGTSRVAASV
jgi:hypothetical protein